MTLWLIRHGETASNAARVVQTPDSPLSERGLDQARRLARRLAGEGVDLVLSSDLRRAVMTAEILMEATGAALELEPLLRERDFGALRGRPYAELGADLLAPDLEPPGGETWAVFHARVGEAWRRVADRHAHASGRTAIVTHGLFCHALAERVLTLPAGARAARGIGNTALTRIEPGPPWRVSLLNCLAHLEGAAAVRTAPRIGP